MSLELKVKHMISGLNKDGLIESMQIIVYRGIMIFSFLVDESISTSQSLLRKEMTL